MPGSGIFVSRSSKMKSPLALVLIAITIFFTVVGQLMVKYGSQQLSGFPKSFAEILPFLFAAFKNMWIVFGLGCAVLAALTWIGAISLSDISFAYPFMGLAIVLVLVVSPTIFSEQISIFRWLGVIIVCLGLLIVARS